MRSASATGAVHVQVGVNVAIVKPEAVIAAVTVKDAGIAGHAAAGTDTLAAVDTVAVGDTHMWLETLLHLAILNLTLGHHAPTESHNGVVKELGNLLRLCLHTKWQNMAEWRYGLWCWVYLCLVTIRDAVMSTSVDGKWAKTQEMVTVQCRDFPNISHLPLGIHKPQKWTTHWTHRQEVLLMLV